MAAYEVLRPIEYGGKLYIPKSDDAPKKAKSAGNGHDIPVDASGVIELDPEVAAQFTLGQVKVIPEKRPEEEKQKAKGKKQKAESEGGSDGN